MKSLIKKLLRENIQYGYFKDKTAVPDFDALKNGLYDELPSQYQKMEAFVQFMDADQYLNECARMQGTTYDQQLSYINQDKVTKYVQAMREGQKFNMGYLDYVNSQQEGRHRIVAAGKLGQTRMPVLIIDKKEAEGNEGLESKVGVWGDLQKTENGNFLVTYDLSKYSDMDKLLTAFSKTYDEYFLDDILSDNIYHISSKYDESQMRHMGDRINLSNYDISSEFPQEFLDTLNVVDGEYELTPAQEMYMKFIIKLSLDDKAKQYNNHFLGYVNFSGNKIATVKVDGDVTFEDIDSYKSAKDLLEDQNPYDLSYKTWRQVNLDPKIVKANMIKYPFK
jgi:hypothetical protein